ncbi:2-phospho-L-lactate guanylyltransferase [Neptuniibacter halophilus]|uniref:2-phospho-L-lactate guanylyltransferase n=1 Tax=Neptuniibacter halophilus TaxID=651666 RepID=UPI00257258BB|nr:2-phospho-L-lactate guanylyltransferase [Neptuniibacter halophilus]
MKLSIVIPMKSPERSKKRLSKVLNRRERKKLAISLFEKNLHFFREHYPQHNLLVITGSTVIKEISEAAGAEVLTEHREMAGLNNVARIAAEYNAARGYDSQLIVPGDIETLEKHEVEQLLNHPRGERSAIVCPSYDGGTNAILTTPPDVMPFSYGPNSCQIHLLTAFQLGLQTKRLYLEKLSFDIDRPGDLFRVDCGLDKKFA